MNLQYAALSYCWGKPKEISWLTSTTNLEQQKQSIRIEELPLTLQNSITISYDLGISCIWIDALCIIQDSEGDWAREAAKMGGIYRGSILTIPASASSSSDEGMLNVRSEFTPHDCDGLVILRSTINGRQSRLYIPSPDITGTKIHTDYDLQVLGGPLANRAWGFQEYVLPRRTLYLHPRN